MRGTMRFQPILAAAAIAFAARAADAQHDPAKTPPLPPAEAEKKFTVPPGFEVRLFAAEPDVVNPVGMAWDERGRLWVLELYEYPLGAPKGAKPRDRVKILEDTDGDGRADKVKVFADGLNLATGLLLGHGGAFVGQAPDLLFLQDADGDDVADRRTVLLTGFGLQDTHELLNGFTWGPDGWLYMTHGVFTHSNVRDPNNPKDEGVKLNAAVARYHPVKKKFEVFADGTSNPWGVDFDRLGNAFVSACVIDHLFHVAPGAVYVRQAGTPLQPYGYDLLPSIVDHKHFRAAYCGVLVYQGDQYPAEYRGTVLVGNIHGNSVNRDRLTPRGATFTASAEKDFLLGNDGWFRPVSIQVGPDGAVWIADWYDKYPCYQNARAAPGDIDRAHGRIWRVVHKDAPVRRHAEDLRKRASAGLIELLQHPNAWQRRTAQRLLSERRDQNAGPGLHDLARKGPNLEARLAALWTLHGAGLLSIQDIDDFAGDPDPAIRRWAIQLAGEEGRGGETVLLASRDPDPTVLLGVAVAARRIGPEALPALVALAENPVVATDPILPFMVWRAAEPLVADDPKGFLRALREVKTPVLVRKTMRRISDAGTVEGVNAAVEYLAGLEGPLAAAALDGLLEGQKGRLVMPTVETPLERLIAGPDPQAAERARRLAALWGDRAASAAMLRLVADPRAAEAERLQGIRVARELKTGAARDALVAALGDSSAPLVQEAIRALGEVGGDVAGEIVSRWKGYAFETRRVAADVLASRPSWAAALVKAVEGKIVDPAEISLSARRTLAQFEDAALRASVEKALGRYRESPAEKAKLIEAKKRVVLGGPVDFAAGHAAAKKACLNCHKLHGEGGDVGPDITGVGRSTLDALLANVIDPNQLVGKGYENVTVKTKDDRVIAGRLVEETPDRITLANAEKRETILKAQIADRRESELSVMPEGLEQIPDADFRNLVWYVLSPPADREARVRIEPGEGKLSVLARLPGKEGWTELLTQVMERVKRPHLHPVRDPSGAHVLTSPQGIFTGLARVNGLDFWGQKEGQQQFVWLLDAHVAPDRAGWRTLTEWESPEGKVLLLEEQAITVHAVTSADHYAIDFDWLLRAADKTVTFGRHDYGGLAARLGDEPSQNYAHVNSAGHRGKSTGGQRAAWTNVERPYGGEVFGVAILDHPANAGHPAAWRVDGHGLLNPSPSLAGDWSIAAGKSRAFHYRIVVHRGAAPVDLLRREFERFRAVPHETASAGPSWSEWAVESGEVDGAPRLLEEYAGRRNVYLTHPVSREKPGALARAVEIPAGRRATLTLWAASHEKGDWELRVRAGDQVLSKQLVPKGRQWREVKIDLSGLAGRRFLLRLENAANDWSWEHAYWADVELRIE